MSIARTTQSHLRSVTDTQVAEGGKLDSQEEGWTVMKEAGQSGRILGSQEAGWQVRKKAGQSVCRLDNGHPVRHPATSSLNKKCLSSTFCQNF